MKKNQSVKVAIRVRPLNKRQTEMNSPLCVEARENILAIKKENDTKEFLFDYVFDMNTRQESIYQTSAFALMQNGLQGYNGTIFAYGQTGAGKTFTMVGDYKDPQYKGIIPRGFDHLISAIQSSEDKKYVMRGSFIEIYNQEVMDLLQEKSKNKSQKKDLKESPGKGVYIKDLKMIPVKSVDQLFKILDFGNKNRTVFATAMNATSSRSHALFTVHIESLQGADKVKGSKINLVDLAGSQRQSKTQATGDRLKQGAKINLSLTALGNVINALVDGKGGHIPYRDSKLTRLLQDSLGGNTKTLMIASISPAAFNYDQTLSTLRYAARARNIKNTPKVNQDPKEAMIRQYLEQIEKLKKLLATGGGANISSLVSQISEEEMQSLKEVKQKASEKQRQLIEKNQQLQLMKQKLKEMQGLVLKKEQGGQQIAKARRIKKKKVMKQQELLSQKIEEIEQKQNNFLETTAQFNKKWQSPQKESQYWKSIVKDLKRKLKQAIQDKKDIQEQFERDREDLNNTIRDIQGQLSLYKQISLKFMSQSDIKILRQNSPFNQEKRLYELTPFLMYQQQISLPKTLKKHEVEDLWDQKRKNYKMKLLTDELPQIKNNQSKIIQSPLIKKKNQSISSPFIQNRRLFKMSDYSNPIYKEKQYNLSQVSQGDNVFRRTNFRISEDSKSRSKSRSQNRNASKGKLEPLQRIQKIQTTQKQQKRPTSRSGAKDKLQPIKK